MSLLLRYPREIAVVVLAGLALTAFWSWVGERERAAAEQARAEVVQRRLDDSLDSLDIERDRRARADSQAARNLRQLVDERAESERSERAAEEAVRLAEQNVAVTLDSIRDNPTPEIREAVNRLEVQIDEERTANRTLVRSLRAQLVVADSTARLWQTRYAATERLVATQEQVIQDYEARLRVALQRNDTSGTGPFLRVLKYAAVFAAGYALASR